MRLLTLKTVLVATDLDDSSLVALSTAKELAEAAGAKLHVIHVSEAGESTEAVQSVLERAKLQPGEAALHVVGGEPARAISALGEKLRADVIVLGPHRKQPHRERPHPFGSTAMAAVTSATAPCLVLEQRLRLPLKCVVVAIDLSDTSRGALVTGLAWASALRAQDRALKDGTKLVGLYVPSTQPDESSARELDGELELIERDAGKWASVTIEKATPTNASPAAGIIEYANAHHADLVVLGTRGSGLNEEKRLGCVASAVTQKLQLPTLLVPPAVWTAYTSDTTHPAAAST
jgi:nucleotide-binding universal stress UspA family protein